MNRETAGVISTHKATGPAIKLWIKILIVGDNKCLSHRPFSNFIKKPLNEEEHLKTWFLFQPVDKKCCTVEKIFFPRAFSESAFLLERRSPIISFL